MKYIVQAQIVAVEDVPEDYDGPLMGHLLESYRSITQWSLKQATNIFDAVEDAITNNEQ